MEEAAKITTFTKSEEKLEDLYLQYFTAPKANEPDDLTQVSLYDYSLSTTTSDSTSC